MHPISALQFLPQYEEFLLKELSVLYTRIIEGMLGIYIKPSGSYGHDASAKSREFSCVFG